MAVTEEDVSKWYSLAKAWGRGDSAATCRETFLQREQLLFFLERLRNKMEGMKSSEEILHCLPSVGKLLGCLSQNCVVQLCEELFRNVIKCILALSKSRCGGSSSGSFERKAKTWAQAQLKSVATPSLGANSEVLVVGECAGFTAQETLETALNVFVSSLCHGLQRLQSCQWSPLLGDHIPKKTISGHCLRELSELALPLIIYPRAKELIESLLCCEKSTDLLSSTRDQGFSAVESLSPVFLETVASTQSCGYSSDRTDLLLSYRARVSLWRKHLPSFENELMDLMDVTVLRRPYLSRTKLKEVICSRDLPRACGENPELFATAMGIFNSALVRTSGNNQLLRVLRCFGGSCVQSFSTFNGPQQSTLQLHRLFPEQFRSLVNKLAIHPIDLDDAAVVLQMEQIAHALQLLLEDVKPSRTFVFKAWQTLLCFADWEENSLTFLLNKSEKVRHSCISVLSWFHCPPLSDEHFACKETLTELTGVLHRLLSKPSLQFTDIQNLLSANRALLTGTLAQVVRRILFVFACQAPDGHVGCSDVVYLVTTEFSNQEKWAFVLDCVQFVYKNKRSDARGISSSVATEIANLCETLRDETVLQVRGGVERNDTCKTQLHATLRDLQERTETLVVELK